MCHLFIVGSSAYNHVEKALEEVKDILFIYNIFTTYCHIYNVLKFNMAQRSYLFFKLPK